MKLIEMLENRKKALKVSEVAKESGGLGRPSYSPGHLHGTVRDQETNNQNTVRMKRTQTISCKLESFFVV